jgi:hypothetical protein
VRCDGVLWEERGKVGGRGGEGEEGEVVGRCHCDLFRGCVGYGCYRREKMYEMLSETLRCRVCGGA